MKTTLQKAIQQIKDYRNAGTACEDACNTILLHLASMLDEEKEQIMNAFNAGVIQDKNSLKYYEETFSKNNATKSKS